MVLVTQPENYLTGELFVIEGLISFPGWFVVYIYHGPWWP